MNPYVLLIPFVFLIYFLIETFLGIRNSFFSTNRLIQNLAFAFVWLFIAILLIEPLVLPLANSLLAANKWHLLNSPYFIWPLNFLILELATYLWHRITHRTFLWNFHKIHHSDLMVDSSTVFRFHFGELFFHYLYKILICILFNISLSFWIKFEVYVSLMSLFHHTSIRINPKVENLLGCFLVTPKHHFNHHLSEIKFCHSNYSSTLNLWDKIFKTYTAPQNVSNLDEEKIGIFSMETRKEFSFAKLICLPFLSLKKESREQTR